MKHPNSEEWIAYLYGEVEDQRRAEFDRHLSGCADCGQTVSAWREAMKSLDHWRLPAALARRRSWMQQSFKWGLAAMLVLGFGYTFGRFASSATADRQQLRAEIQASLEPALRQKLRQEIYPELRTLIAASQTETESLLNQFVEIARSAREEERQSLLAFFQRLERQHLADFAYLRNDLETVALTAENKLQHAQEQIVQLVNFTESPTGALAQPDK